MYRIIAKSCGLATGCVNFPAIYSVISIDCFLIAQRAQPIDPDSFFFSPRGSKADPRRDTGRTKSAGRKRKLTISHGSVYTYILREFILLSIQRKWIYVTQRTRI